MRNPSLIPKQTSRLTHRVEVRVINVASLLQAEHDANAFAKQWTVSEKVAIGRAIEEELSKRVGRPAKEMVENFPPFSQGMRKVA